MSETREYRPEPDSKGSGAATSPNNAERAFDWPRVLVVSNNPFSRSSNNGKTLASFFDTYPKDNLAQLYFSSELPSDTHDIKYFRINERDYLTRPLDRKLLGAPVSINQSVGEAERPSPTRSLRRSDLARISRELLWMGRKLNGSNLKRWLDDIQPELVFFCAGDSGFAYSVVDKIKREYGARLALYITDDYVLPRHRKSLLWHIRRRSVLNHLRRTVADCDLFFTVSPYMREIYRELLGRDSDVILNMSNSMMVPGQEQAANRVTRFLYAGGLHSKRYLSLLLVADAIATYNASPGNHANAFLDIYTNTSLPRTVQHSLNRTGVSKLHPYLPPDRYSAALCSSDIPVHIESFDRHAIEITRLSLSTKIPEYLSLGKPILAVGPPDIASMRYLSGIAHCVTSAHMVAGEVGRLLRDTTLQRELGCRARQQYENHHKKTMVTDAFLSQICSLAPSDRTDMHPSSLSLGGDI